MTAPTPPGRYIGRCCRDWILAITWPPIRGRCGYCNQVPEYVRPYDPTRD